jgi:hypothetical protein
VFLIAWGWVAFLEQDWCVHESGSGTGTDWNGLDGLEQDWCVHESSSGIPHLENRNDVNDSLMSTDLAEKGRFVMQAPHWLKTAVQCSAAWCGVRLRCCVEGWCDNFQD